MKTKILITAASILFSISIASANPTGTQLTFFDSMGRMLIQPLMAEEATEALPFEIETEMEKIRKESIYRVFDISALSKPEVEEELPFDLQSVFQSAIAK